MGSSNDLFNRAVQNAVHPTNTVNVHKNVLAPESTTTGRAALPRYFSGSLRNDVRFCPPPLFLFNRERPTQNDYTNQPSSLCVFRTNKNTLCQRGCMGVGILCLIINMRMIIICLPPQQNNPSRRKALTWQSYESTAQIRPDLWITQYSKWHTRVRSRPQQKKILSGTKKAF